MIEFFQNIIKDYKAVLLFLLVGMIISKPAYTQEMAAQVKLDHRVEKFLKAKNGSWRDMNIPDQDGKVLFDIIIKNGYTSGLEIGTSTGHSTIWIAWALSKTGGKLITLEIDETRHRIALANLKEAGLNDYVDARLADAHTLVPALEGPFDFVFSDADKGWYTQYFKDVDPKIIQGGCYTAHNVTNGFGGVQDFLEYIRSSADYTTTIDKSSNSGISISYKKAK